MWVRACKARPCGFGVDPFHVIRHTAGMTTLCFIPDCGEQKVGSRGFCAVHDAAYSAHLFGKRSCNVGAANPRAKLTDDVVRAIRADGRVQRVVAEDYGVSPSTVSLIKLRKIWTHVG